jgi:hypothetical protein
MRRLHNPNFKAIQPPLPDLHIAGVQLLPHTHLGDIQWEVCHGCVKIRLYMISPRCNSRHCSFRLDTRGEEASILSRFDFQELVVGFNNVLDDIEMAQLTSKMKRNETLVVGSSKACWIGSSHQLDGTR